MRSILSLPIRIGLLIVVMFCAARSFGQNPGTESVLAVVNAFNLMDNLDGAAGTVGAVSAAGAGVLATMEGDPMLGALALSLAGACGGFLPFNLSRPARVFLGDGGSMPIGFVVAPSNSHALPGEPEVTPIT